MLGGERDPFEIYEAMTAEERELAAVGIFPVDRMPLEMTATEARDLAVEIMRLANE